MQDTVSNEGKITAAELTLLGLITRRVGTYEPAIPEKLR